MDIIKKKVLKGLEKYRGIISSACQFANISRQSYYNWMENDPEFKQAVDDISEAAIDFVEGKLFEKINGVTMLGKSNGDSDGEDPTYTLPPSDTAIIFYLKTKGKKRGYIEKSEVEHTGQIDLSNADIVFK
jgi:hypothetical protein